MDFWLFLVTFFTMALDKISTIQDHRGVSREFCHLETFNATCGPGEVVLIQEAKYGRMKVGRCLATSYYVGCYADVLSLLDFRCSGKRNCTISVLDPELLTFQPCRKDLMAYLEARYTCVTVPQVSRRGCSPSGHHELTASSGYLLFGRGNLVGTYSCPWRIAVSKGQRIEFTAFDFRTYRKGLNKKESVDNTLGCHETLIFVEGEDKKQIELCAGSDRLSRVYTTTAHEIHVYIQNQFPGTQQYTFLLSYKAIGCPDLHTSPELWVRRNDKTAIVTCNRTRETWHLVCKDDTWIGDLKNCSTDPKFSTNTKLERLPYRFHYGILIAVALGLILGILLGTVMLVCMMSYRRKRRQRLRRAKANPLLGDHMEEKGRGPVGILKDNASNEGTLTSDLEDDKRCIQPLQLGTASQELLNVEDGPDIIYSPRLSVGMRCQSGCVACNGPSALGGSTFLYGRIHLPSPRSSTTGPPPPQQDPSSPKFRVQNIEMKDFRSGNGTLPRNEADKSQLASV